MREQFRKHGVNYECSEKPRSELYRDLLISLINSGAVDLIEHEWAPGSVMTTKPTGSQYKMMGEYKSQDEANAAMKSMKECAG